MSQCGDWTEDPKLHRSCGGSEIWHVISERLIFDLTKDCELQVASHSKQF